MITMIVIVLALCAVLLFYVAARSRSKQAALRPVDITAFRTLMERDDELFLRARLPGSKFTGLKRQRIRVTLGYVGRIAGNAAVVLRLAEPARHSQDPEVAQAAAQVMELATNIRLQCLVASAKLCAEFAMPSLQLTPALLAPKYQTLRENVLRLGALQTQNVSPLASAI